MQLQSRDSLAPPRQAPPDEHLRSTIDPPTPDREGLSRTPNTSLQDLGNGTDLEGLARATTRQTTSASVTNAAKPPKAQPRVVGDLLATAADRHLNVGWGASGVGLRPTQHSDPLWQPPRGDHPPPTHRNQHGMHLRALGRGCGGSAPTVLRSNTASRPPLPQTGIAPLRKARSNQAAENAAPSALSHPAKSAAHPPPTYSCSPDAPRRSPHPNRSHT